MSNQPRPPNSSIKPNDTELESETENDKVHVDTNNELNDLGSSTRWKVKIMTELEAEGSILNARELGYTLRWNQNHVKRGKSGKRYQVYKKYTTFDEVDSAENRKDIKSTDLRFDVVRGSCE